MSMLWTHSKRILLVLFFCAIVTAIAQQIYEATLKFRETRPEVSSLRASLLVRARQDPLASGQNPLSPPKLEENVLANSYIQDTVRLPDHELLLLVRLPKPVHGNNNNYIFPEKSRLRCVFSDEISTRVIGMDFSQGRLAVRCRSPPKGFNWARNKVAVTYTDLSEFLTSRAAVSPPRAVRWNYLVYESFVNGDTDIVLFAKGVNRRLGLNVAAESLRCVFNGTVETVVTVSAQEVFRCAHPERRTRPALWGSKVSLRIRGKIMPSVAYYYDPGATYEHADNMAGQEIGTSMNNLCACTMVYNVAKFVKEWVMYHSYLGVRHFFLYDNNSEDDLGDTVATLGAYNVTRRPWVWSKTQEAGFSHCALLAKERCRWMMFADVDEFAFSSRWLRDPAHRPDQHSEVAARGGEEIRWNRSKGALELLLEVNHNTSRTDGKIPGQISIYCRNFGPSGMREHPADGVTQGYTCREKSEQRHKSIVLLEAISSSLANVIHHFGLKPGFRSIYMKPSKAVINHYKYQAWSEFKAKFTRRASAYVVDWKQSKNPLSQDRTPGLGNLPIEPPGWHNKFCEINDTALQNFTRSVFSIKNKAGPGFKMQWQL